ncbi:hypothetical protein AMAG_08890 [Allomyces macrogynus ATCC 38327]|uniref:Uncharacterized protein n=1 Tax=Allomyces macrogynus (strain ATCC 38327) TaxID=578462 RepID=A0A0L0SN59_ALLM3|nr:hypothetical protein AMAG_08890 [Allomyces macrogynus ATCC 38327]|eukprot:KNE63820.1 hypothetical protein AMAG_08890 [Allomyces macrogynus ATCC 38327]
MNMLMTKLIQRMKYISLTLHRREDVHKDALEQFYIQLVTFELVQALQSRMGDNSLQAPIGWFRTIFLANVFGLDYAELAQIRDYFCHVYFMDENGDVVHPFDFLFHLEKTAALLLVLATQFDSLIISDRLLTLLEPIDPMAIGARLGSFDWDKCEQSWKARTRYAEFDLRDTIVPLIGKILAKDHAVWRLVKTKLTRIDRARFQTRLAVFLLLVYFNYGPRFQKLHSATVETLVSDKRHGEIVVREDVLRKEEYQEHLNEQLMRKEQQQHADKLPPRIHAAVLAWVARVHRFRTLRHEYVVPQGVLPPDVQVEYEEHLVARLSARDRPPPDAAGQRPTRRLAVPRIRSRCAARHAHVTRRGRGAGQLGPA